MVRGLIGHSVLSCNLKRKRVMKNTVEYHQILDLAGFSTNALDIEGQCLELTTL